MPPCLQRPLWLALATTVALGGCSLVRSVDEYDEGDGAASSSGATGGSSASGSSTSSSGGGGGGGGPADCGTSLYPAAATLVDTFDDRGTQNFLGCAEQLDGELRAVLPGAGDHYCTSTSQLPYCLTSSSFTFQLVEAATASIPGMQTWIILRPAGDTGSISLLVEGNGLQLLIASDAGESGIAIPSNTYDPFMDVWFRLAGEGGELVLSTSPDAEAWTERGRGPAVLDLDGVFLELGANRYYNDAFPGSATLPAETARFDCLNAVACR